MTSTTTSTEAHSSTTPIQAATPAVVPLSPGEAAPGFALRCSQHCAATLDDYRGRTLVLVFYVADWHPVCTGQLERYRDFGPELERLGADLVAISPDTLWSHAAFARAHRLTFPLLSDDRPRGTVARAYGVYDAESEQARRGLFVVDAGGTITWSAAFPEALDPGIDGVLTAVEELQRDGSRADDGVGASNSPASGGVACRRCQSAGKGA